MYFGATYRIALLGHFALSVGATVTDSKALDSCPGYNVLKVLDHGPKLTAVLRLAGKACNVFGNDLPELALEVTYETKNRIHVKITDPANDRYEVSESVLPRPKVDPHADPSTSNIRFNYTSMPFGFSIYRASTHEVLFSTASHPIIFEPQYLRVKTTLPADANIYGLGEHTDPFRLPTHSYTRTLWARNARGIPQGSNLYGVHPVYFEHRTTGTHGVFIANSNGMDVKINDTEGPGTTLEYNVIGGVLDFYFLAGDEDDPTEVARQYAEIVGTPAEVPYWSFGFHQCRWGYQNYVDIAQVITNYSAASIPLETMWTDIDYMYRRLVFTLDPDYFPLNRMREIIDYLHSHGQRYILMVDPAVGYLSNSDYGPYNRGAEADIWLKAANGSSPHLGAVWPGVAVWPDWFHEKAQDYWTNEFRLFFDPDTGLDVDGSWIDLNEPTSFCIFPCTDPFEQSREQDLPPARPAPPPDPNTPIFGQAPASILDKRGHRGDDLEFPPYAIANLAALHANGLVEYDAHNLFGTMMSTATHNALLARRPGQRTVVITRSTFAGAGKHVGKWLGDNLSEWSHYRQSISGILGMAGVYQMPMVGADVCGFAENTTETLCARWATLGAFYPFMRNHNTNTTISQEFYRWPLTTRAAQRALDTRYRLLDYLYTAFHQAQADGTPVLRALWYAFPKDTRTFGIDTQFLFGPSILVSPVIEENATSVEVYYPAAHFYDLHTLERAHSAQEGARTVRLTGVDFTEIPVAIMGGVVLPLRVKGAMTTTELRARDFELVVAPDQDGRAAGSLYVDDGVSVVQERTTAVSFEYRAGRLAVRGAFGYPLGVKVARVRFAGVERRPDAVSVDGEAVGVDRVEFDSERGVLDIALGFSFDRNFTIEVK
ncbi:alpha-glucosidase [Daedaleopsis nitida]|nr:alpha-glucosidase [Daedaleopsis nitida]